MDRTAQRIRAARQQAGLSLRQLSSLVGVSASMLSQIETGKARPSVTTLYELVSTLGLSLDELIAAERDVARTTEGPIQPALAALDVDLGSLTTVGGRGAHQVHHAGQRPTLELESGVIWEQLTTTLSPFIDHLLVTYPPGSCSSTRGKLTQHTGFEQIYMTAGTLTLQVEFETHTLAVGDSFGFESSRPHLYCNDTSAPAVGIWFIVGRSSPRMLREITDELRSVGSPAVT